MSRAKYPLPKINSNFGLCGTPDQYNKNLGGKVKYRPTQTNDLDEIHQLYSDVIANSQTWGWDKHYPSKEMIQKDIESHELYCVEVNKQIIAVCQAGKIKDPNEVKNWQDKSIKNPGAFARITVHLDWRGKGIGKYLTQHILNTLYEHGFDGVRIKVAKDNLVARKLYDSLGFNNCGEVRLWDIDWLAYEKSLGKELGTPYCSNSNFEKYDN